MVWSNFSWLACRLEGDSSGRGCPDDGPVRASYTPVEVGRAGVGMEEKVLTVYDAASTATWTDVGVTQCGVAAVL